MRSGQDVLERAKCLLNYTHTDSEQRALAIVNQIYADIWYTERREPFLPLRTLSQPLLLSARQVQDVMPYGVAMLLALSEGDGDNQQLYATIYNRKRAAAGAVRRRCNVLFRRAEEAAE